MCGITGVWLGRGGKQEFLDRLPQATRALSRRGPDDEGLFVHNRCALGHRRLSILDTSSAGHQPMTEPEGRFTLAFNGEIFNFRELRQQLQQLGHSFSTGTDTEVILRAYRQWGRDCLHRFNGFFALALYDQREETLMLARDRMGIKPLWYAGWDGALAFASEQKALYAWGMPRELNVAALYSYLQLNYLPGRSGIYQALQRLDPGCTMTLSADGAQVERWWNLPQSGSPISNHEGDPAALPRQQPPATYEAQQEGLRQLLDESVQARMVADVPLGAFLSGGIDSSVIVALASRYTSHLATFSIGYRDEPFFDETRYAELVARRYKTDHTVFSLSNDDLFAHLHDTLDQFDQPFADSSALAVSILSRETRKQVTVALSGDGADELFAGYHKHMGHYRVAQGGAAAALVGMAAPVLRHLPQSRQNPLGNTVRQLLRFAEGRAMSPAERYWRWCGYAAEAEARSLLAPAWRERLDAAWPAYQEQKRELTRPFDTEQGLAPVLFADQRMVLPGDMLHKVDTMSMAHSLEVRVPFLDHRIVDYAARLPLSSKIQGGMKKRILQDAFRSLLPDELYKRPKHGFEVPLLKWFRADLRGWIADDLLADDYIAGQGIFELAAIRQLKDQLFSPSPGDVHARIWALVVFQYWWRKWHLN